MRSGVLAGFVLAVSAGAASAFTVVDGNNEFADREALAAAAPFVATGTSWSAVGTPAPATSQWTYRRKPAFERGRYISRSGFDFDDEHEVREKAAPAR